MHSVLDVEHPLVRGQLRDIDAQLQKAEESLNWNSQGQGTNLELPDAALEEWCISVSHFLL